MLFKLEVWFKLRKNTAHVFQFLFEIIHTKILKLNGSEVFLRQVLLCLAITIIFNTVLGVVINDTKFRHRNTQ